MTPTDLAQQNLTQVRAYRPRSGMAREARRLAEAQLVAWLKAQEDD